jgi:hypothetical protein
MISAYIQSLIKKPFRIFSKGLFLYYPLDTFVESVILNLLGMYYAAAAGRLVTVLLV